MAIIKAVSSRASIARAINYITRIEKTDSKLITGVDCRASSVIDEMEVTKLMWGKTGGRTYKHFIQSFHPDEQITPEEAHQIALEWVCKCENLNGFECIVATHNDKDHIHSHIIVNSVNFITGKKFNMKKSDLGEMKMICNNITKERGLSVPEKGKTFEGEERETIAAWNRKVYEDLRNESDWRYDLADKVLATLDNNPTSFEEYEADLADMGIGMRIGGKTVTYFDLRNEKHRLRDSKIEQYFNEEIPLGKDGLHGCFEKNAEFELVERIESEEADEFTERKEFDFAADQQVDQGAGREGEVFELERREFEALRRRFETERTSSSRSEIREYEDADEFEL